MNTSSSAEGPSLDVARAQSLRVGAVPPTHGTINEILIRPTEQER